MMSQEAAPRKTPPSAATVLRVAVDALRKHGEDAIADRALRVAAAAPPEASVVIVGEISRGKSSLVNTLVGAPANAPVAPVDTEMATSIYVRYVPATDDLPVGAADIEFPGVTHRIDVAALADWVTVGGADEGRTVTTQASSGADGDIVAVGVPAVSARVGIASTVLPDTVIVDTPGVGSLIPEHVEAVMSASRGAGVLVMVCDATAPMSAPELEFLGAVGAEISSVVIVVTKIDLVMRQWRTVLAENRTLIARHAPRFAHAPIIGVSNRVAAQAASIADPETATRARAASGVSDLVGALTPLVRATSDAPERNALQVAFGGLDTVRTRLLLEIETVKAAPAVRVEIEAERERLAGLKDHKREWQARLQQDMAALSVTSDDMLREEFDGLFDQWSRRIDKLKFYEIPRASKELVSQMTVDLEAVAHRVSAAYVVGVERIADELFSDSEIRVSVLDRLTEGQEDLHLRGEKKVSPWKNFLDPILITTMASGGPLALIPGVGFIALPVWAGIVLGFRATRTGKENHRKWLTKAVNDMKGDVRSQLKAFNAQAMGDLRVAYDLQLESALAESAKILNDAAAESKRSAEDRKQAVTELRTKVTAIDTIRKNIVAVLKRPVGQQKPAGAPASDDGS
ncbi:MULTISPECIES: dynamin family protein [unclassified Gordonia (in: high G+C Gram-positive bacteria)]